MIRFFRPPPVPSLTIFAPPSCDGQDRPHLGGPGRHADGGHLRAGAAAQQPGAAKPPTPLTPNPAPASSPQAAALPSGRPPPRPRLRRGGHGGSGLGRARTAPRHEGDDPTLLTHRKSTCLQQLAVRRETIETREREIDMREGLLKAAESRIDKKVQEMETPAIHRRELILPPTANSRRLRSPASCGSTRT
jgi:hypothetical protein